MDMSEFDQNDLLVSVHNYPRWSRGRTEDVSRKIMKSFPGKVYGLYEDDSREWQHGREFMDDELETEEGVGYFDPNELDIGDPDYVVLIGGNIGSCHGHAYESLEEDLEDAQYIFPPEACFGYVNYPTLDEGYHTLKQFQKGTIPVDRAIDRRLQDIAEETDFERYDWSNCSIQRIEL